MRTSTSLPKIQETFGLYKAFYLASSFKAIKLSCPVIRISKQYIIFKGVKRPFKLIIFGSIFKQYTDN